MSPGNKEHHLLKISVSEHLPDQKEIYLDDSLKNKYLPSCCSLCLCWGGVTVLRFLSAFLFCVGCHMATCLLDKRIAAALSPCTYSQITTWDCVPEASRDWLHRALAPGLPRVKWQRTSNQNRHVLAELKQGIRNREVNPLVESYWASIHLTSSPHSFEMYFLRAVNRTN